MNRRALFTGAAALLCAPSIVRVASLMPISALPAPSASLVKWAAELERRLLQAQLDVLLYGRADLVLPMGVLHLVQTPPKHAGLLSSLLTP